MRNLPALMRVISDIGRGELRWHAAGMTLMECVMAVAVISMALPAVMLVVAQSRSSARDAVMEGHARRAMFQHVAEWGHRSDPGEYGRVAWAHSASGQCLGRIDDAAYHGGVLNFRQQAVGCLVVARMGEHETSKLRALHLCLEYPASAPAMRRKRIDLHTCLRK